MRKSGGVYAENQGFKRWCLCVNNITYQQACSQKYFKNQWERNPYNLK
jgi:hypothetical protein